MSSGPVDFSGHGLGMAQERRQELRDEMERWLAVPWEASGQSRPKAGHVFRGAHRASKHKTKTYRDLASGIAAQVLKKTGWAVLFGAGEEGRAGGGLRRLIELRKRQAGARFHRSTIPRSYRSGQAFLWQELHEAPGVMDPEKLPYYVLIVAAPKDVSFEFQYELSVNRAVGRLYFDDVADYRHYADAVLEAETTDQSKRRRSVGFFPVDKKGDSGLEILREYLVDPVSDELGNESPQWRTPILGDGKAAQLKQLLRGQGKADELSALVVACHGKGFEPKHPEQPAKQGGLCCLDGRVYGADLDREPDPAASPMLGKVVFLLACFGAGMPKVEDYDSPVDALKDGTIVPQKQLADEAFVAALPQRLLANGVLGVVGHVNRGFTSSFRWLFDEHKTQASRSFKDMLARFLSGARLGHAMRPMSRRSSNISSHFLPFLQAWGHDQDPDYRELARQWLSWVDARNYILLGDPAAGPWNEQGAHELEDRDPTGRTEAVHLSPAVSWRLREAARDRKMELSTYLQVLLENGSTEETAVRGPARATPSWESVIEPGAAGPLTWAVADRALSSALPRWADSESRLRESLAAYPALQPADPGDAELVFRLRPDATDSASTGPPRRTYRDGRPPVVDDGRRWRLFDRSGNAFGPFLNPDAPRVWRDMRTLLLDASIAHELHRLAALASSTVEIDLLTRDTVRARILNRSAHELWLEVGVVRGSEWHRRTVADGSPMPVGGQLDVTDLVPRTTRRVRSLSSPSGLGRCHVVVLTSRSPLDLAAALDHRPASEWAQRFARMVRDHEPVDPRRLDNPDIDLRIQSFWPSPQGPDLRSPGL